MKSQKTPPSNHKLESFEDGLFRLIRKLASEIYYFHPHSKPVCHLKRQKLDSLPK